MKTDRESKQDCHISSRAEKHQLCSLDGNKVWQEQRDVEMTSRACVGIFLSFFEEDDDAGFGWVAKRYFVEVGIGDG